MELQLSTLPPGAKYILQDNPFFVIGISSLSSSDVASGVIRKVKSLERLGAASSYKTEYNLCGIEKPDRSLSSMQVALDKIKDNSYRWLWFTNSDIQYGEMSYKLSENWRDLCDKELNETDDYNVFLLNLLALLIEDATFLNHHKWRAVLLYVNNTLSELNENVKEIIDSGAELKNLKSVFVSIITSALGGLSIEEMCDFYNYLYSNREIGSFVDDIIQYIVDKTLRWAEDSVSLVRKVHDRIQSEYADNYVKIPDEEAKELLSVLSEYDDKEWKKYEYLEKYLQGDVTFKEAVRKVVITPLNWCRVKLHVANNYKYEQQAAYFYSKMFHYYLLLFPEYKENWRQGFKEEYLDIPLDFFTVDQLTQKARFYFETNQIDKMISLYKEMINKGIFEGYKGFFDYYQMIDDYSHASEIMEKAYAYYTRLDNENKRSYYSPMVYMLLSADIHGDLNGLRIYRESFDSSFPEWHTLNKEEQFETGKHIFDSEPSGNDVIGWYWLIRAFLSKNIKACLYLGILYYYGRGVQKDYKKSIFYFNKGCNSNPICAYNFGYMTYNGEGTNKDEKKGLQYIKYAADLGHIEAINWLKEHAENSIQIVGYKNYNIPRNKIVLKNQYCSIFLKDVSLNANDIEIKLWIVNKNTVPIIAECNLIRVNNNTINRTHTTEIQSKELCSVKSTFSYSMLSEGESDEFILKINVKDKEKFGTYYPILVDGLLIIFRVNNSDQEIKCTRQIVDDDPPVIVGSKGFRNRQKSTLEISFSSKVNKEIEKMLIGAGYKKAFFGNNWSYSVKDNNGLSDAEELAKQITGNGVMG